MTIKQVEEIAAAVGGEIDAVGGPLPDGSGFATVSFPLPKTHWIYEEQLAPPMPFRMGVDDPRRQQFSEAIRSAARYAIRAATMNGKETDFDPDAMVQNLVVGMVGYHTADGLCHDLAVFDPDPVPPVFDTTKIAATESEQ